MLKRFLPMIVIPMLAAPAFAADDAPTYPAVRQTLATILPGVEPDRIAPTPVAGVLEVGYGPQILYVSEDGRFLFQGNLIDVAKRENITETHRATARVQALADVGEKDMIIFAPEKVKHTVTVFTDIDCGYCRKLHNEIEQYRKEGIRVRYLAFPRAGLGSESYDKAVAVWCAKDRNAAMTRAKSGESVEMKKCDNPVQREYELGERVGVSGTPTIITEDGRMLPGYLPAKRLVQVLEEQ